MKKEVDEMIWEKARPAPVNYQLSLSCARFKLQKYNFNIIEQFIREEMFEQNQRQAVASSCISKRSDRKPFILPGAQRWDFFNV